MILSSLWIHIRRVRQGLHLNHPLKDYSQDLKTVVLKLFDRQLGHTFLLLQIGLIHIIYTLTNEPLWYSLKSVPAADPHHFAFLPVLSHCLEPMPGQKEHYEKEEPPTQPKP